MSDVQKKNERKERKTLDEPGVNIKMGSNKTWPRGYTTTQMFCKSNCSPYNVK